VETLVYVPVVRLAALIACRGGVYFDDHLNSLYDGMGKTTLDACKYVGAHGPLPGSRRRCRALNLCGRWRQGAGRGRGQRTAKEENLGRFEWKPGEFNIKNINFDSLILAFMLGYVVLCAVFLHPLYF
jgi:hypothetical protein